MGGDVVEEPLRALHLADDDRPRLPRQDLAREDHQEFVAPENAASGRDHANPVAVAVVGDADVGALRLDHAHQVRQILRNGGIRMVIREPAVGVAE